jgi:hypothetical protein
VQDELKHKSNPTWRGEPGIWQAVKAGADILSAGRIAKRAQLKQAQPKWAQLKQAQPKWAPKRAPKRALTNVQWYKSRSEVEAGRYRLCPIDYDPPFDEPDNAIRWLCPIDYNPPFDEPDDAIRCSY